jgi:flagellum-specific peptidoglycan hydrolase FlgJ
MLTSKRELIDIVLPDPIQALSSTSPVVLGIASVIAADKAVVEAQKAKDYALATQKMTEADELSATFRAAATAQFTASKLKTGNTKRTRQVSQLSEQLDLISAKVPELVKRKDFAQLAKKHFQEPSLGAPSAALVELYIKQEYNVPEISPKALARQVKFTPTNAPVKKVANENEQEVLISEDTEPATKHTKRNIGVTAVAVATAGVSILNPASAAAAPINPGSAAASLNIPKSSPGQSLVYKFDDSAPAQPEADATEQAPSKPETPTMGIEAGQNSQPVTSPEPQETTTPEGQLVPTSSESTPASLGIPSESTETTVTNPAESNPVNEGQTDPKNDGATTEPVPGDPALPSPNPTDDGAKELDPPVETSPDNQQPVDNPESEPTLDPTQIVTVEEIFTPTEPVIDTPEGDNPTEPSAPSTPTADIPVETDNQQAPAVSIYAAAPTSEDATSRVIVNLNQAEISSETPLPAPKAEQNIENTQEEITLENKSDAHKLSISLASDFNANTYELNNNDLNSYLESLTNEHFSKMVNQITDTNQKKEAKTHVDNLVAYAKLISQRPGIINNPEFAAKAKALINQVPSAYKQSKAIYSLLLLNGSEKAGSNQAYLNSASTGSPEADKMIQLLTTAAVATASNKPITELPDLSLETKDNNINQPNNVEIKVNEQALLSAVDKYVSSDIKANPEKLAYFKKLVVSIAKEAAKSHADVNLAVVAAQGALETGWGEHAHGNNLFGIKAGSDWNGEVFYGQTWEVVNGQRIEGKLAFRQYDNPEDSVADRLKLVGPGHENFEKGCAGSVDSYLRSLQHQTTSGPQCKILVRGKLAYATDPSYETTIKNIISSNGIEQIFKEGGLGNYAEAIYAERQVQANRSSRDGEITDSAEVKIPHGEQVAAQAREWVKTDPKCSFAYKGTCLNHCLNIVSLAWQSVGEAGIGDLTANDAYQRYLANGWVNKKGPVPVGAILWSQRASGAVGDGHVYIYLGNGKAASNIGYDYKIVDLNEDYSIKNYGHKFLGWSAYNGNES